MKTENTNGQCGRIGGCDETQESRYLEAEWGNMEGTDEEGTERWNVYLSGGNQKGRNGFMLIVGKTRYDDKI